MVSFFLLILISGCGGKSPSKTKFTVELSGAASAFGGLVIYGTSGSQRFCRVIPNSGGSLQGTITEELPKGLWTFGAIGWMGAEAMSGEIHCAFDVKDIQQDSVAVSLRLSNASCFDAGHTIVGASIVVSPSPLVRRFEYFVGSFWETSVETKTNTVALTSPNIVPAENGFVGSFRLRVPSRSVGGAEDPKLASLEKKCYEVGTNDEPGPGSSYDTTTDGINLPAFLPSAGSPIQVEAFLSSDCDASGVAKGLIVRSLADPQVAKVHPGAGANILHVSTPVQTLCALSDLFVTTGPASGNGTVESPWLICNENQLVNVQQNFSGSTDLQNGKFVLGRDLNLFRLRSGVTSTHPDADCHDIGDTFTPIGKTIDGACAYSDTQTGSTFSFNGNGRTISHFRFRSKENWAGFVSYLQGSIHNLNFDRASLEGPDDIGVAAGVVSGGIISHVKVTDSDIRAKYRVGGVVGQANGASTLSQLHVKGLDLEGETYVGGIVGDSTTSPVSDTSFSGSIYTDSSATLKVGGIAGATGSSITRVTATGRIHSGAQYVGGIAGFSGSSIVDARSDVFIYDFNPGSPPRDFGGITGSGSTVLRSFFRGSIDSSCASACGIGQVSGNAVAGSAKFSPDSLGKGGDDGDTTFTYSTMTSASFLTALNSGGTSWSLASGDFPRLSFESGHPCSLPSNLATITSQVGSGRGSTSGNPIAICTRGQLATLDNAPGRYFELKQDISLEGFTPGGMTFSGHFDGSGRALTALRVNNTNSSSSLFGSFTAQSSFKNVLLAGFQHTDSGACVSCGKAILAQSNAGVIENVEVSDFKINVSSSTTSLLAGVVVENTGVIKKARVHGKIQGNFKVGGVAFHNVGRIEESYSDVRIDLNSSITATNVGGVVGRNRGVVSRNTFRGEVQGMALGSSFIGGIIGFLENSGSDNPVVIDNHVDTEAKLLFVSGIANSGGIVGFSTGGTNLVARNLMSGFIFAQTPSGTINPIVGAGTVTNFISGIQNRNFHDGSDYELLASSLTVSTFFAGPGTCQIDFSASPNIADTTGAIGLSSGDYYQGSLFNLGGVAPTTYQLVTNLKQSDCDSINGSSGVTAFKSVRDPQVLDLTVLKGNGFDVASLSETPELERILQSYFDLLQGQTPKNPPIWMFDTEEGLRLFNAD